VSLSLSPENSLVLLVDWQERLVGVMPEDVEPAHRAKAEILLRAAVAAGVPVIATEQYPKGLGPTVESLALALDSAEEPPPRIPKRDFAATDVPEVNELLEAHDRSEIVVVGMESHICVWQTVRALTERGYGVHVPRDAVVSRRRADYEAALSLYLNAGAVVTSVETVVFDWVRRAEGPVFKAVSKLVR
jgi:nicotinamidase-related amidase